MTTETDPAALRLSDELGQALDRWYCVSRHGLATICKDKADALAEVIAQERDYPRSGPYRAVMFGDVAAERAEIARLRKALGSIATHYSTAWPAQCQSSVLIARKALEA